MTDLFIARIIILVIGVILGVQISKLRFGDTWLERFFSCLFSGILIPSVIGFVFLFSKFFAVYSGTRPLLMLGSYLLKIALYGYVIPTLVIILYFWTGNKLYKRTERKSQQNQ